jgi:predicted lysophospholipase L1 biosynthesis ABC-type transport system permease subunit
LSPGDRLVLCDRTFQVSALQPQRGNQDDITLWIPLAEAQQILKHPGQINAIMALECNCATERLASVRAEIAKTLPDTQVIEFSSSALARVEARNRAAQAKEEAAQREADGRARARLDSERLFAVLIPLVIGAAAIWVGLLAWGNVRSRTGEIGILRALGVPTRGVLALFLARAALMGLLGAALGFAAGWLGSWLGEERLSDGPPLGPLLDPLLLALVLLVTPLLSALVSWLPALGAAQVDPASTLRT